MKVRIGQRMHCKRCDYLWHARKTDVRICPNCKSPYFDKKKEK